MCKSHVNSMKLHHPVTDGNRRSLSGVGFLIYALLAPVGNLAAQNAVLDDKQGGDTTIPLVDGSAVGIDPATGDVFAQPQADSEAWQACLGAGGSDTCQVDIVNEGFFEVSPSSVTEGGSVTASWDSRGAWDCVGWMETADGVEVTSTTWDDSSSRLPRGSASISTSSLEPGDYVVFLDCMNGPSTASATQPLSVTESTLDAPEFCSDQGRVPPAGMTRDTKMLWSNDVPSEPLENETVAWDQFFYAEFPRGETNSFEILKDHYGTLAFSTGSTPLGKTGSITFEIPQFSQDVLEPGDKLVTISQCPGDFTTLVEDPECRKVINNSDIRWKIESEIVTDFRCTLLPDTTYFLNIIYTPDAEADPLEWGCTGGDSLDDRCGNRGDHLEDS